MSDRLHLDEPGVSPFALRSILTESRRASSSARLRGGVIF